MPSTQSLCVGSSPSAASTLGICEVADLVELLLRPWGTRNQPEREPTPQDRRGHIAHGSRLAKGGDLLRLTHRTKASGLVSK